MELAVEPRRSFDGLLARGGYAAVKSAWEAVGDRIGERRAVESSDCRLEEEVSSMEIGRIQREGLRRRCRTRARERRKLEEG